MPELYVPFDLVLEQEGEEEYRLTGEVEVKPFENVSFEGQEGDNALFVVVGDPEQSGTMVSLCADISRGAGQEELFVITEKNGEERARVRVVYS